MSVADKEHDIYPFVINHDAAVESHQFELYGGVTMNLAQSAHLLPLA